MQPWQQREGVGISVNVSRPPPPCAKLMRETNEFSAAFLAGRRARAGCVCNGRWLGLAGCEGAAFLFFSFLSCSGSSFWVGFVFLFCLFLVFFQFVLCSSFGLFGVFFNLFVYVVLFVHVFHSFLSFFHFVLLFLILVYSMFLLSLFSRCSVFFFFS